MQAWEQLLGVTWPRDRCDRSGECCRGAAQLAPWNTLLAEAAQGSATARAFLNQYVPYRSRTDAESKAPDGVAASLAISESRGDVVDDLVFYHCRFLSAQNDCQIYEDRPALCRDFPESPFGAIPRCCGYHPAAQSVFAAIEGLREQLRDLKKQQAMLEWDPKEI